jgi:hypothetical protein
MDFLSYILKFEEYVLLHFAICRLVVILNVQIIIMF